MLYVHYALVFGDYDDTLHPEQLQNVKLMRSVAANDQRLSWSPPLDGTIGSSLSDRATPNTLLASMGDAILRVLAA
jgi:hypothetical protein